jgi:hypothetical protein
LWQKRKSTRKGQQADLNQKRLWIRFAKNGFGPAISIIDNSKTAKKSAFGLDHTENILRIRTKKEESS